jgi:hypothetical protein
MPIPEFKVKSGVKPKAAIAPNYPCRTEHRLVACTEERLYTRGVPTLYRGSRYVPAGQPVTLERPPWPAVFDCCMANNKEYVHRWLASGHAKVDSRNPRVRAVSIDLLLLVEGVGIVYVYLQAL